MKADHVYREAESSGRVHIGGDGKLPKISGDSTSVSVFTFFDLMELII